MQLLLTDLLGIEGIEVETYQDRGSALNPLHISLVDGLSPVKPGFLTRGDADCETLSLKEFHSLHSLMSF